MLNITICTSDGFLRKKFELALTQLMNSNRLDYHLTEVQNAKDIPDKSILILGDSDSLYTYTKRKMMIVVLNDHTHDEMLSGCCLTFCLEKADLETKLTAKLMAWLDYYFDNYHVSVDELNEFMLPEVLYFTIQDHHHLRAHLKDKMIEIETQKDYSIFYNALPLNFLIVGTEYIINLDEVSQVQNGAVMMNDGTQINGVNETKLQERQRRFEKPEIKDIYIGDKYSKAKIRKAKIIGISSTFLIGLIMAFLVNKAIVNAPLYLLGLIVLACVALLFLPMYCQALGASGNYYELREDGIRYFDALTMMKRYRWSQAIAKGREEDLLALIPYADVSCIRLSVRETVSPMGAAFMYYDIKKYALNLRFETITSSFDFDGTNLSNLLFGETNYNDIAKIVNLLMLMGKKYEGNEQLLAVLNDPNASLQQYLTRINTTAF